MKLYFVRHGETKFNKQRLIQGRIDEPLNKTGIKQAKDTGQLLKQLNFNIDKIISSPLSRAFETAHLVARKNNYKDNILVRNNLVERDFGNYELDKIVDSFPKIMTEGFSEEHFEDNETLLNRIKLEINELYKMFKGKTLVLTVHAHVIRSIYILMNKDKYNYTNFYLGNCSIHVFNYDGKKFELLETHNNEEK